MFATFSKKKTCLENIIQAKGTRTGYDGTVFVFKVWTVNTVSKSKIIQRSDMPLIFINI